MMQPGPRLACPRHTGQPATRAGSVNRCTAGRQQQEPAATIGTKAPAGCKARSVRLLTTRTRPMDSSEVFELGCRWRCRPAGGCICTGVPRDEWRRLVAQQRPVDVGKAGVHLDLLRTRGSAKSLGGVLLEQLDDEVLQREARHQGRFASAQLGSNRSMGRTGPRQQRSSSTASRSIRLKARMRRNPARHALQSWCRTAVSLTTRVSETCSIDSCRKPCAGCSPGTLG